MKQSLPTWDLSPMYQNIDEWERDFAQIKPMTEKFLAFKGKLAESPETLKAAIECMDEFERLGEKVYVYAHLKSDEDTTINANRSRLNRVESLFASLSANSAWFDPEIMAIPEARMDELINSPVLAFYKRSLLELLRERAHTLSEKEEQLLGNFGDVLGNPDKTFEILSDADLDLGKVKNHEGKTVQLTHGNYRTFLEDADREVRKRAFKKMFGSFHKFRNTFAATLDGAVKRHVVSAKVRNYPSALEMSLHGDNVPKEVYLNLIASVRNHLGPLHQYIALRQKVLKLDAINMYDLYCPLFPECKKSYTFDQAVTMVKAAIHPLGKEYLKDVETAFAQRWADVPERKGKRSGAYSSGCYDSYPYMLLNFNHTLNDVFTLAHELGHSMHSFYSHKHQHYHYASYSIFVAEVASTTNEILLFEEMMRTCKDKTLKAFLLSHLIDEIRTTIYRQTMFAEFELKIHETAAAGTPLSADLLSEMYYQLNAEYYGPGLQADQLIEVEWARIPHFYYNFYVYKYATGLSAAIQLAENLLSGDPAKREAYLGFLKAGDSKDVLDIMRDAGVDLSQPAPINAALAYFEATVEHLQKLVG